MTLFTRNIVNTYDRLAVCEKFQLPILPRG